MRKYKDEVAEKMYSLAELMTELYDLDDYEVDDLAERLQDSFYDVLSDFLEERKAD